MATSTLFVADESVAGECGIADIKNEGYLSTCECNKKLPYVCASVPLDKKPDYSCPKGFYPYRGKCLYPHGESITYDEAVVTCATKGSIVMPIKDKNLHDFVIEWAGKSGNLKDPSTFHPTSKKCFLVKNDVWIGLRKLRLTQIIDNNPALLTPMQESTTSDLTYSDGVPFTIDVDYMLGAKTLEKDCYYLKQSSNFELRDGGCSKTRGFICQWRGAL